MLFYWNHKRFRNFALMKKLILSIGAILALTAMTGCDKQSQGVDYRVTCHIGKTLSHDSATLLVLEEAYGKLRVCGSARNHNGTFTFSGQTDKPKAAFIRWDTDSVHPFLFVLENGDIRITIDKGRWSITGSAENSKYLHYINQRNAIMDSRVATWQQYLNMAADSSLKRDDELRMVLQDSLLNDSLQRMTVELINRGDAVGRIIRERYGQTLDLEHMRKLK